MEALQKAFERMPNTFTSKQFLKVAREFGYPENKILGHDNLDFMRAHARQSGFRKKTWEKFSEYQKSGSTILIKKASMPKPVKNIQLEQAIEIVKAAGLKIMKQTWTEL